MSRIGFPYQGPRGGARKGLRATVARLADELAKRLGRPPSDEEMARTLAVSVDAIKRARGSEGG